ncbi:MAG: hypothetical protein R2784_18710 [Saprospiraceae bacterium]
MAVNNADYNNTSNPDHAANNFRLIVRIVIAKQHGSLSTFDHTAYYPFTGAHVAIQNDCNACHNGVYSGTPNTCADVILPITMLL